MEDECPSPLNPRARMQTMFSVIGNLVLSLLTEIGNVTILGIDSIKRIPKAINLRRRFIDQMYLLVIKSIPMAVMTAAFVSMAFAFQITNEFIKFGAGGNIGGIVAIAMWRELGPLLTAVVFCGRVGAAISAELASMKVTEQVDALESMSQNPVSYLVIPRVLASIVGLPLLVGLADIVGFLSGFIVANANNKINPYSYFESAQSIATTDDITGGLIKAAIFGLVIALISCYSGLQASEGAKDVGLKTTSAVVYSLISLFILNYFLSALLF